MTTNHAAFLRRSVPALALFALASTAAPARAEDPPAPVITPPSAEKPPELGTQEGFLAPVEAGKPIDWVTMLKTQLTRLRTLAPLAIEGRSVWLTDTFLQLTGGKLLPGSPLKRSVFAAPQQVYL